MLTPDPDGGIATLSALPREMRDAKRWVLYKIEQRSNSSEKLNKVPYCTDGGKRSGDTDSPEDIARMATFDDALAVMQRGGYSGLGFALGPDGNGGVWQGIDLDHLSIHPELEGVANALPSYVEVSPGGDGKHAIGYGKSFGALGSNKTGIEAYCCGRYFTVTGKGEPGQELTCIASFVEQELTPRHAEKRADSSSGDQGEPPDALTEITVAHLRSALAYVPADDYHMWVKIGMALKLHGDTGRGLWEEWSQKSEKYHPKVANKTWKSFKPREIGIGSVFHEAQQHGWINPERFVAEPVGENEFKPLHDGDDEHGAAGGCPSSAPPNPASAKPPKYPLLTLDDVARLPPTEWLVKKVLPAKGVAAFFGASGSGKSFLILDLLAAVADGRDWFGYRCRQTPVVYVVLEGQAGIPQRVRAFRERHGNTAGHGLRVVMAPFNLLEKEDALALVKCILEACGRGAVVVIDTLNQSTPGADENSSQDMGRAIAMCQQIQRTLDGLVVLVHHTGKDVSKGLRGHSSLNAALDAAIEVSRSGHDRYWTVTKAKDGADGAVHGFRLDYVGFGVDEDMDDVGSCIVVPVVATGKSRPVTSAQQMALDTLTDACIQHGQTVCGEAITGIGVHLNHWRDAYNGKSTADNPESKRKAFQRARAALVELGRVVVDHDIYLPVQEQGVIQLAGGTGDRDGTTAGHVPVQ